MKCGCCKTSDLLQRLLIVFLYVNKLASSEPSDILQRKSLSNSDALCNDFSQAVYYLPPNTGRANDNWVIFFEGGGGCSTFQECNDRWDQEMYRDSGHVNPLMSSLEYGPVIHGRDLLSSSSLLNPLFYNYTHVLVPYCTQDAFLANRSNPNIANPENYSVNNSTFNRTEGADNFVYKGRVIFESVIMELIDDHGLADASKVVLAGSSAGGIGVLNNLDWVETTLQTRTNSTLPPEVVTIVDSSWFITFSQSHAVSYSRETAFAFNLPPACSDFSLGFACCTSPSCLFGKQWLQSSSPIFAISSTHDILTLEDPLLESLQKETDTSQSSTGTQDDRDLLRIFNSYGSIMNESFVQSYNAYPNLTIFAPSCTQHVYLANSDMWAVPNGVLAQTVLDEVSEPPFVLRNPVRSGNWMRVRVEPHDTSLNMTLFDAIVEWYSDLGTRRFYADRCTGPVCGDYCTSSIDLDPRLSLWPEGVNIFILAAAALLTAIPSMIKLGLFIHMKYIMFCQRLYAFNLKHSPKSFPKATHPINISCVNLYYRIDTVNKTKAKETDPDLSAQYTEDQYDLYAGLETFLPCCKKMFPDCVSRYKSPVHDQQTTATAQLVRTDSGISSSVNRMRSATPMSLDSMSLDSLDLDTTKLEVEGNGNFPHQARRLMRSASSMRREKRSIRKKTILHRVNMYVNPGELVAIMGPSGSGKTTLLDVLLGRRRAGYTEGEILINGTPLHKMREWFIVNTGYVRQLAKSYYNELTVRENLIFSMSMQAQKGMKLSQKLERVEQVIREMGLLEQADIKVGDGIGLGLSGGQRKRLAIAIQLLSMPNIIFLDEPTSGLDSASSLDILKSLQVMAGTGRAIVVTIHQPRSEIFHAFDKILLLCNGQIAFFGSPVKVWEFFRVALISEKELKESEGNVQDAVLDLLKEKRSQKQVLHAYRDSSEPKHVKQAVLDSKLDQTDFPLQTQSRNPGIWHRLVALESRASLRQTLFTIIYLPIVYTILGLILGTTYLFTNNPVQVLSVTCILSCSSSLFMSSIIASLLMEPLKLFYLEHSDGISKSHELILQVFIRMTAVSTLPLVVCATIVFGLVYQSYSFNTYVVLLLAFLLVNQVWISIFIVLTVLAPTQAHRLCPVFAAIGGFCCGFIVPKSLMPPYYSWIFYINPSFYAYSATGVTVLEANDIQCNRSSTLECFRDSGLATIQYFGLEEVNPFQNLVVLMAMVTILLILGILILQLKVNFGIIQENIFNMFCVSHKRQRRKRVSSIELLQRSVDHPAAMLTNVVMRRDPCKPGSKAAEAALEEIDGLRSKRETLRRLKHDRPSSQFLENGFHYIMHDFPWNKKEELMQDLDTVDGELQDEDPTLFSPMSRRSRIMSDGSEDVFEPPLTEMMINMEEDQNEEARRIHANLKWNLRRQKIENEFWRLRHLSINRSRAAGGVTRLRHSVSFGDDLEIQLEKSGMRELEKEAEQNIGEAEEGGATDSHHHMSRERSKTTMTLDRMMNISKYGRSMSMPSKDFDDHVHTLHSQGGGGARGGGAGVPPNLETHREFAEEEEEGEEGIDGEEEEEDEGMLGLPPKDIPNISMEQLDWTETDNDEEN